VLDAAAGLNEEENSPSSDPNRPAIARLPKRRGTGAVQDAGAQFGASELAPASWSAVALHRFLRQIRASDRREKLRIENFVEAEIILKSAATTCSHNLRSTDFVCE
jgi:hypothetical protein